MTKLLKVIFAGALCALAFSSVASAAKTVGVDISKAGFVPANVSLQVGDTVTFTNKDTANHQAVCQTCPFTSPVLKPNETFSYTFTKAGKFTYTDPLNKNKKGTATVAAAPAVVTLAAAPSVVVYGGKTTLSGAISTQPTGEKVDILAQVAGENAYKVITTVTTAAGGTFSYAVAPTKNTSYEARAKLAGLPLITSSAVTVKVRPKVGLRRLSLHHFKVSVTASDSFVGKYVVFQRYIAATAKWRTVKSVQLKVMVQTAVPLPGTFVSTSSFTVNLKKGYKVRAILAPTQVGSSYLAGSSPVIRS
jgi:plastocyanin